MWTDCITCAARSRAHTPSVLLTLSHPLPLLLCQLPSLSPSLLHARMLSLLSFPSLFAHLHSCKEMEMLLSPFCPPFPPLSFAISLFLSSRMESCQCHSHWKGEINTEDWPRCFVRISFSELDTPSFELICWLLIVVCPLWLPHKHQPSAQLLRCFLRNVTDSCQ